MMGVRSLILTNSSGAVTEAFQPGSLALISDHINLQGTSPLTGPNEERWGPRFPDLKNAYDTGCRRLAREAAAYLGFALSEGVYAGVPGPNFETLAEVRYLQRIGADMVGMSTVQETIAARHMGLRVMGLSVISNLGAGLADGSLSHEEVLSVAQTASPRLTALLQVIIPRLAEVGTT
jgi:purine-nucleoside phosphorylase